ERAVDIGADAVQIFVQSPRAWKPTAHPAENIAKFRELREAKLQGSVAHAIYLINVASDDPELWEKSATALDHTMRIGAELGLDAVIFHPGSHKGAEGGTASVADRVAKACLRAIAAGGDDAPMLLLENAAGQGGTIGRNAEELAQLIDAADRHPKLGVCLDSCHWYASGIDVTDTKAIDAELEVLDQAIGLERLQAIHLNDSKMPLGSNRDRHDNIGDGLMGEGLGAFVAHPKFQGLGAYLETPGAGDGPRREDITAARELRARWVK
ncbi:MAG: deoxyribonuclease IV, partial [Thermoleophilia bacterium]|nr:deoxyribonuclease IV [Thermoleophilia bacterium]